MHHSWFSYVPSTCEGLVICSVTLLEATNSKRPHAQDIPTAKVLIEALSPAPSPTGKAARRPVEVRTLNIRVGLPQEDYPDQENMLVDLAQIMQVRRKRRGGEAKSGVLGNIDADTVHYCRPCARSRCIARRRRGRDY